MTSSQTPGLNVGSGSAGPPVLVAEGDGWLADRRAEVRDLAADHGAVLVRGLSLDGPTDAAEAVAAVADGTMTDTEAFAGRDSFPGGMYSSSAWPPTQLMCMHHEASYRSEFPGLMMFACLSAPTDGGAIGLADSPTVLNALPSELVERFDREGWILVRNYTEDIGLSVDEAFGTDDRAAIEQYCKANFIEATWQPDGDLRTRQRRPAVMEHPGTGVRCWFNQIAFLSQWTLNPEVRNFLVDMYGLDGLPFNTCYGNGDQIPEEVVELINEIYDANSTQVTPASGDLLVVDNIRTAHSRDRYEGPRQVLVALADPVRRSDLEARQDMW